MKTKVCLSTLDSWDFDDFTLIASFISYDNDDFICGK